MATDTQEDNKRGIPLPSIETLLNFIQDRDARLGLVLSVFLLLLLVFAWFSRAYGGITQGGFFGVIQAFGAFLALATCFVIFFKAIDGSILPKIIVWYFTSLLLLTVSAFWVQAILRTPAPFLIEARCFADLWSQGCPLGTPMAQSIQAAPVQSDTSKGAPDPRNRVFVQFSGSLDRAEVTRVSLALKQKGWNVRGAESGGERTAQAVGIDQVRYFHAEDEALAKDLAADYNALGGWPGFDPLSVALVTGHENRVPSGHLEVWTSVE